MRYPALAADPPLPQTVINSPTEYHVWSYKYDGVGAWVGRADYGLTTTDQQKAVNYAATVNSYAGWQATTDAQPVTPTPTPSMPVPYQYGGVPYQYGYPYYYNGYGNYGYYYGHSYYHSGGIHIHVGGYYHHR